jgi:hypothetical protein
MHCQMFSYSASMEWIDTDFLGYWSLYWVQWHFMRQFKIGVKQKCIFTFHVYQFQSSFKYKFPTASHSIVKWMKMSSFVKIYTKCRNSSCWSFPAFFCVSGFKWESTWLNSFTACRFGMEFVCLPEVLNDFNLKFQTLHESSLAPHFVQDTCIGIYKVHYMKYDSVVSLFWVYNQIISLLSPLNQSCP